MARIKMPTSTGSNSGKNISVSGAKKATTRSTKGKLRNRELLETQLSAMRRMPEEYMKLYNLTEKQYDDSLKELERQLGLSKQGMKSRRKGSVYERRIGRTFLDAWGIKLVRTPMSGGFQKSAENEKFRGDLNSLDDLIRFLLHMECKDQVTWKPKDWYDQAASDCPPGKYPVVVMHRAQKIVEGKRTEQAEDYVMMKLSDFLHIADQSKLIIQTEE